MGRVVLFCLLMTLFLPVPSYSTDEPVEYGIKLYKMHHYEEAADLLHSYLTSAKSGKEGAAYLSIGMACLKNAELYRELYHASLLVHLDYLKRLSAVRGKAGSRFVDFYMGETLLENGKPGKAASHFKDLLQITLWNQNTKLLLR